MFLLSQIKKELLVEKTRIFLTILAIAWGTFAISTMLAIGEGLKITFAQTVSHSGHNLLIIKPGRTTKLYRGRHTNVVVNLTMADFNNITKLPNIKRSTPVFYINKKMRHKKKVLPKTIYAVAANYNKIHEIQVLPGGRFLSPLDIEHNKFVIVLGTQTAKDFFPKEKNPVNQHIYIGGQAYLIVGVMKHKSQMMGHKAPDTSLNWIPYTNWQLTNNPHKLNTIDVTYRDPNRLPQLQQHIQQMVALKKGLDPNDDNVVHLRDYLNRQGRINTFFFGLQVFLGIVGTLTLLVAGVGIANVMFASVARATREIGIRMAIGARTYQILLHYIVEALLATLGGGILGLAMAWLVVYGLRKIPMHGKLFSVIGQPKPILSLSVMIVVVVILGIVGLLAGLFPALKAAKIDPAEALTYE